MLGDSSSYHLVTGLHTLLKDQYNVLAYASSACPAVRGVDVATNPGCRANMDFFFDTILPKNKYDLVIVSNFLEIDAVKKGFKGTVGRSRNAGPR